MSEYADEQAIVIWTFNESIAGLSRRLMWRLAVRSRSGRQLDFFLETLEEKGSCAVIVKDPEGGDFRFPCRLAGHALAAWKV